MLTVDSVSKTYPPPPAWLRPVVRTASSVPVEALRAVSLTVTPGEVVGLVGPNGAGKTTLIKIISGLIEPSGGAVTIGTSGRHGSDRRRLIGLVLSDDRGLYWRLTGRQNLEFFAALQGVRRRDATARSCELLAEVGLADRDRLVFGYSSGMRARLGIARALLADPPVLLLDEPTRSLDPLATAQTGALLRQLAAAGRAVLLSSHRLDEVVNVCDRVVVLAAGQVRYTGDLDGLRRDARGPAAALTALLETQAAGA